MRSSFPRSRFALVLLVGVCLVAHGRAALADLDDSSGGSTADSGVAVWVSESSQAVSNLSQGGGSAGAAVVRPSQWQVFDLCLNGAPATVGDCSGGRLPFDVCADGAEPEPPLWVRYAETEDPIRWGAWQLVRGYACTGASAEDFAGAVRSAWESMPIAPHVVSVQPDTGWVFSSVPTIFWVDREPRQMATTILGRDVLIRALPGTMTWDWGHGTPTSTTDQGNPYPNQTLTHTYAYFAGDVVVNLTSTWSGQYSLDGGVTWLSAPGTATTRSVPVPLTVYNPHTHIVDCDLNGTCYG